MRSKSNSDKPIAVDLYCGCGGLTQGLKDAGFRVVGAIDIDPFAIATYEANHSDVDLILEQDIRILAPEEFLTELGLEKGELDLLAGCPPCQGFSTIRTLNGAICVDDPRNDLLFDFLRFVRGLRPRTVMMENVPGLAKDERFLLFLEEMRKMGYLGEPRILDAADYGVPQRRRRLIYVAGLRRKIPYATKSESKVTVREIIGSLPRSGESGDPIHDFPERRSDRIKELICSIPKDGGSRSDLPKEFWLECHKRSNGFKDVYGRMAWDDVAPTITSGCFNPSKGRFLHPEEDRAISMREASLLQGFPESYMFSPTKGKVPLALVIGNALPPPFISAHAKKIAIILSLLHN